MEFNEIKVVEKPWGRELLIAAEDEYVGKIIEVDKGKRLSFQYHNEKKETMFVLEGRMMFTLDSEVLEVSEGQSITIKPGQKHRVEALTHLRILEVSTTELDDVVRLEDDFGR